MAKLAKFVKQYWFILSLILLGGFLRLYRLEGSLMFLGDQGRDALAMKRMLIDHDLPFIGPITSVGGFYLGPLYFYLMAPFLWLARYNPVGPAMATALLGIITIPVLYLIAEKMLSKQTAGFAALLYTLAVIPISETRSAWNPNPMPLAALGIIYGLYQAVCKKKPNWLLLSAFSLAVALQLHYMIVFLGPFLVWQIILSWRQPKLRMKLLQGLAIFLLVMSPLILFEIKNNFLNFKGLIEFLTKNEYSQLDWFQVFKNLRGRSEQAIGMILGFGRYTNFIRTWITRGVLIASAVFLIKKPKPGLLMVIIWLLSTIAVLAVYHSNVYPHYLGFLFPAVFLLTGEILSRFKGKLIVFTLAFFSLFIFRNYPQISKILSYKGNLNSVKQTSQFIEKDIKANQHQQVNLALLDDTRDYRAMNYRYFLELTEVDLLDIDEYPQANTLYVISPYQQTEILENPTWEVQSLKPAQLTQTWQLEGLANIYKIERL
jgi:4-amino-4-deoxy-L-arabinose transferase-like glycosyltransferase